MIGNLTKPPELRTTPNNVNVCTFSIAVNRRYSKQGEKTTDFFNIVAWRTLADVCAKYLDKGKKVAVSGELQTRSYEAKDGSKRYITEIVADEVEFLSQGEKREEADVDSFQDIDMETGELAF